MIAGRRIKQGVLGTGVVLTLLTGLIGYAHTPAGRPMLMWLANEAGCPLGGHLDPASRDAAIKKAQEPFKGSAPAASLAALGFTLGSTTKQDAEAWATREGVQCKEENETDLRCSDVPATALRTDVAASDLLIAFDANGRLQAVDLHTASLAADDAARIITERTQVITAQAGPATETAGIATGAYLAQSPLMQARASFRYSDYRAELSATNLGDGRIVFRETHQAL